MENNKKNIDFINKYMQEIQKIIRDINKKDIDKFIEILFCAWKNNKKIITMGNGGSASTASHFTGDLLKTVVNPSSDKEINQEEKGFKAVCLNDNPAVFTAWINDCGWDKVYSGLLNTLLDEGDVILLVSVHGGSGWSGNLVQAMEFAKKRKAIILSLAGFDGGKMKEIADCCIVVPKKSTPHVEGFHSILQHLIIERLTKLIKNELKGTNKQNNIKFFADTASLQEIEYCFFKGVNEGITTNPKIIELTGNLSLGFENICKTLLKKYPDSPISLETDLRGIDIDEIHNNPEKCRDILLQQSYELARWQNNVVIKIPCCEGGILTTKILSEKGIKTNFTACITPYQALEAEKAGATYISLFANRMVDSHILELAGYSLNEIIKNPDWKEIVKQNKEKYFEEAWKKTLNEIAYVAQKLESTKSKLIVGSIRSPDDVYRIIKAKPQVITIPTKIVKDLVDIDSLKQSLRKINPKGVLIGYSMYHPMTQYTLKEFEKSADFYKKNE